MTAVRYTFDRDFEDELGGPRSREKLEQVRQEAFEQGREAGQAEVRNSIEQQSQYLLQNIQAALQVLATRHQEQEAMMQKEAAQLAHAITGKLAPALVAATPLSEVEALVSQCLKNSPLEPRLVIRVDDSILPALEQRINDVKMAAGFAGDIVLISEPMRHVSDCRVEWADGGAERDFDALKNTIDKTIHLFIDAPSSGQAPDSHPENGSLEEGIPEEGMPEEGMPENPMEVSMSEMHMDPIS